MQNPLYSIAKTVVEIQVYIGDHTLIALDIETAPLDTYRDNEKAALDSQKASITGISLSVAESTGIYIPLRHRTGGNASPAEVIPWLTEHVLTNPAVMLCCHNLSFESAFFYALGIIIQPPVYDTICAAQMTLKSATAFRTLTDSGLKTLVPELLGVELPSFGEVTGDRHFDELDPDDPNTVCYACSDADYTLRLYHLFNNWLDRWLPKHRYIVEQIESPSAVYVGLMRHNGLLVNVALMEKNGKKRKNGSQGSRKRSLS